MMLAIGFPALDPVAIEIGPVIVRWYAVAYVVGLLTGWRYVRALARLRFPSFPPRAADDLVIWCTLGVVVGGRLGFVLFYQPDYFFAHPAEIFQVWQGGMSFHGGLIGTFVALIVFAHIRRFNVLTVADMVSCAVPIGLFFGRIANFVNGELYGRVSSVPWAMVFPDGGFEPRHPSQLYQAAMEGLILFAVITAAVFLTGAAARPGRLTGIFLVGYGVARIVGEVFREPDSFLGFITGGVTMGQLLSLPMLALGVFLLLRSRQPPGFTAFSPVLFASILLASVPASAHSATELEQELAKREPYVEIVDRATPDFALEDANGRAVSLDDLRGKVVVLWFIYTSCPDECPLQSEAIAAIQGMVNQTPMRDLVTFVSITTDPVRDTPQAMRDYGPAHGLDPANWLFLTSGAAHPDATREIAERFGLKFTPTRDGELMHGAVTHLIDKRGRLRARYHGLKFDQTNVILYINALTNDHHH